LWWTIVLVVLAVNAVTHPALWFLFPRFGPPVLWFLSAEAAVVIVEAVLMALALTRGTPPTGAWRGGARAALAANAFSAAVGVLCAWQG
jgi:hypothetical protein